MVGVGISQCKLPHELRHSTNRYMEGTTLLDGSYVIETTPSFPGAFLGSVIELSDTSWVDLKVILTLPSGSQAQRYTRCVGPWTTSE